MEYGQNIIMYDLALSTLFSKKEDTQLMAINCQILTDFQNSFCFRLSSKFAVIKAVIKHPNTSQMHRYILPCEIVMQENCSHNP